MNKSLLFRVRLTLTHSVSRHDLKWFCATVIESLIAARKKLGLTQLEVAQRLGKPQSYIAKIEGKDRKFDVVEFGALYEAIHQDPSELIRVLGGDNHD